MKQSLLYCGDNKGWLQGLSPGSIDLCYIDPPFFSRGQYEVIWGNSYEKRSFDDRFKGGIRHYIEWMKERIHLIHKLLKSTGSLYLHCDHHASHYLKVACDEIFGEKNFRNEIVWKRTSSSGSSKSMGHVHDKILFYAKSERTKYKTTYVPLSEKHKKNYSHVDKRGQFMATHIEANEALQGKGTHYTYKGYTPKKGWLLTKDKLEKLDKEGKLYWTKNGKPLRKYYLHENQGRPLHDLWDDIGPIAPISKERIGYKTQKPESLLRRIIKASTKEGDWILDCFVGGGTTAKVCAELNRNFICGDISPVAVRVTAERLNISYPKWAYEICDLPRTEKELKQMNGHAFASLVCRCMGWDLSEKKTDDQGIDGFANNRKIPIQVKNHTQPVGRPDIQQFAGAMHGYTEGFFVAWNFSKKAMEYIAELKHKENKIIKPIRCKDDIFEDILISQDEEKKIKKHYKEKTKRQMDAFISASE